MDFIKNMYLCAENLLVMQYFKRHIDKELLRWKDSVNRKPLLLRGARQVGKSTAVRQLGKTFKYFVEINLEKQPSLKALFTDNIDVRKICADISAVVSMPVVAGETLLFIDEIQMSQQAVMSLRYFKEDYPQLHVIAAGSLLEFTLSELPSFGVGRIRSMYVYPFSFDEFLTAQGLDIQVDVKNNANPLNPLPLPLHESLQSQLRTFFLTGGMPAAVAEWLSSHDYAEVSRIHNDILDTYQDDFAKYKSKIAPSLLRQVLRSAALQAGKKFVYAQAGEGLPSQLIKSALELLSLAGIIVPVTHTNANGIPLGAEENQNYRKFLFLDTGLMLTMLGTPSADIILANDNDLVNKGAVAEMFAGLELVKYADCYKKAEIHYWQNLSRNANAEVDYLIVKNGSILPIEIKANTKGSMQSLYYFMNKKHITNAARISMENFGMFTRIDADDNNAERRINIYPLYAIRAV